MEKSLSKPGSLTPSQQKAVAARGNVLVMAGAGTGKTKTLVERCLDCLDRERVALDELLVVTFTEAAAAEMRLRLRKQLEAQAAAHPADEHWPRQLALFDAAHIGTLHSFCLRLVREHFYELGLDPQFALLDEGEARQRAAETLDEQFQSHYAGEDEFSLAVQELIQIHGGGRDEGIRQLVLRLHHYSQARPDAAGWLAAQIENFSSSAPAQWQDWLLAALADWREEWLSVLDAPAANEKAVELTGILQRLSKEFTREAAAEVLTQIVSADGHWPPKKKTLLRKPLEKIFDEAAFLTSLASVRAGRDPLAEDWAWVRGHMVTLLRLAQEFAAQFGDGKRRDGVVDFHDLEQFALRVLLEFDAADRWRARLRFIFVDEYQDINAAQDQIIAALSRGAGSPPGQDRREAGATTGNRFLVGDVKQSIYRFRLADPKIFRDYARHWHGAAGETIPLSENFRSREGLLDFVNSVCRLVMREEVGGVGYDADAELKFGSPQTRGDFSVAINPASRVELLLRRKAGRNEASEDADGDPADLDEAQKEARLVATRLNQLVADRHEIWDEPAKIFRPVEWRDVAILLRSPRGKSEIFVKEFERAGIPLAVARGGFFQSAEILDLLSLLRLLDNPLQDVPCLAVLRSPLVGLSLDELAQIRLAAQGHFWTALNRFHGLNAGASKENRGGDGSFPLTPARSLGEREEGSQSSGKANAESGSTVGKLDEGSPRLFPLPVGAGQGEGEGGITTANGLPQSSLSNKVRTFLARFARWRRLAKQNSLSQCLEEILAETLYADWLRAQPRGPQRAANVAALLNLAQAFDQFQRQGLFRFLKFIEAQQAAEAEPEVAAAATENAVRLMSIHQSKGLEFPVVVLADLAKTFNEQDLSAEIIFDEEFGLCPKVKPPTSGRRYPSLPHWLAQRRQKRELRGEELRLLYVALTRARDSLLLTATITEKNWDGVWTQPEPVTPLRIAGARSFADWLALWFAQEVAGANSIRGEAPLLRWRLIEDGELESDSRSSQSNEAQTRIGKRQAASGNESETPYVVSHQDPADASLDAAALARLRAMLSWSYPFTEATVRPAKSSVTTLRREAEETDAEAEAAFTPRCFAPRSTHPGQLSAAQVGAAHHKFLQRVALDKIGQLAAEADRLARENYLTAEERSALDLPALGQFWDSDLGKKIVAHAAAVRRELPFTARFTPAELAPITGRATVAELAEEFVVVQGVADLAVLLPEEIWLVDFKTDAVGARDLPEKIKTYAPQLKLYAAALERIFRRPVTLRALHFLGPGRTETLESESPASNVR